jgi:hypothetical protein
MKSLLKRVPKLADSELHALSEAIDNELDRRAERADPMPQSARRRFVERSQSYRHQNGASAPPIRVVGRPQSTRKRRAAA